MDTENSAEQTNPVVPAQATGEGLEEVPPPVGSGMNEPASSPGCGEVVAKLERIEKSLDRIVDHLQLSQREERIREFSLSHLAAAICLVLSVVFIIAAVLSLLQTNVVAGRVWATVAFLGAISMQGLSLILFTVSRRK